MISTIKTQWVKGTQNLVDNQANGLLLGASGSSGKAARSPLGSSKAPYLVSNNRYFYIRVDCSSGFPYKRRAKASISPTEINQQIYQKHSSIFTPIARQSRIEDKLTKGLNGKPATSIHCNLFSSLKSNQETKHRMRFIKQDCCTTSTKSQNKIRRTYNPTTKATEIEGSHKGLCRKNKEALKLEPKVLGINGKGRYSEINILEVSRQRLVARKE